MAEAKAAFLENFAHFGIVRIAALKAGVCRTTVHNWKKDDPEFAAAYRVAEQDACDVLEAMALQRARSGLSDACLIFLLKARNPSSSMIG